MSKLKKLWILFITTFSISATTNGGYAIVAAMKSKFVEKYGWLQEDEMMDLMSMGQSVPGPVAINTSVLVGWRVAGIAGAIITLLGTITPPIVIMSLVTVFYELICENEYVRAFMKGMQAGVAALLVSVTIGLFTNIAKKKSVFMWILLAAAFAVVRFTDISVFYIALVCAAAGIIKTLILARRAEND